MAQFQISDLLVEYQRHPLGIDETAPRFSWKIASDTRGWMQAAYRLSVRSNETVVWDSGKVAAGDALNVLYAGVDLQPCTRYDWTLTVYDTDGDSRTASDWFETGLMNPSIEAWDGAQWIGSTDLPFAAHALSVFQIDLPITIAPGSVRAAFVLGVNDPRLMQRDRNLQGMEAGHDESYVAFELDLSAVAGGGQAMLHCRRAGYTPQDDPAQPLYSAALPSIHIGNAHEPHTLHLEALSGGFDVFVDGVKLNNPPEGLDPIARMFGRFNWNLNPTGKGSDFLCFPMLCDIGFRVEAGQQVRFGKLCIRNYRKPANPVCDGWPEAFAAFADGETLLVDGGSDGWMRTADPSNYGVPMLRRSFCTDKPIASARVYITARGVYELYCNGERVDADNWFNPGLTQYNKTHLYQTFDVTERIGSRNVLAVSLGEGWWDGAISFEPQNWNFFGDRSSLLCKLVLTYTDGSREVLVSDEQWKLSRDGALRYSSFFQGELYDFTRADATWCSAGYDDSAWLPAEIVPLDEHTAFVGEFLPGGPGPKSPVRVDYDHCELIGQIGPCVGTAAVLTAQALSEPRPGVYVYDMGQNLAGVPEITLRGGKAGQVVTLRYAEVLYPDLPEYGDNVGMVMLENIRAALATDQLTLRDGDQSWRASFTFHGYRYVEITGIDAPLPLEDVRARALSSVTTLAAGFSCSNPAVNQLWSNITWSLRDNFISIPTDCPQRNERMGWSGDISVFSRTATYLADCPGFLRRQARALRDTQADNGRFADIAPIGGGFGGVLWGSAGCTVPYEAYLQFGDTRVLAEQFDAMCAYLRFLRASLRADGIVNDGPLGDWLGPQNETTEPQLLWQSYYIFDLDIVCKAAAVLNRSAELAEFSADREAAKAAFRAVYLDAEGYTVFSSEAAALGKGALRMDPATAAAVQRRSPQPVNGRYRMDTQSSYAVPLALNVLDGDLRTLCERRLADTVTRENLDDGGILRPAYSLMTGFIGTAWISQALASAGEDALAYRLLQNEQYPSWLYPVRNGATTIWERLNSYTVEDGFGGNNSMNSFNHYSFGAVGAWMCQSVLGIRRGDTPASFALAPVPDPDGVMTFASGHVDTVRGTYASAWERTDGGTRYRVTVPAGVTAPLTLRAPSLDAIRESGSALDSAACVQVLGYANGAAQLLLGSGDYDFFVTA